MEDKNIPEQYVGVIGELVHILVENNYQIMNRANEMYSITKDSNSKLGAVNETIKNFNDMIILEQEKTLSKIDITMQRIENSANSYSKNLKSLFPELDKQVSKKIEEYKSIAEGYKNISKKFRTWTIGLFIILLIIIGTYISKKSADSIYYNDYRQKKLALLENEIRFQNRYIRMLNMLRNYKILVNPNDLIIKIPKNGFKKISTLKNGDKLIELNSDS